MVNGPKTWSLAAALHPEIAAAYDAAQDRAAAEIIGWLAEHATTRVGPRGRQVQVPVEKLEAAVVRHYTSRAGDPHRHLHLQINARVFAAGKWRGLHSVGVVDSIEAINGIGHAAVMCDPEFREALAAHGYTLDADTGEVAQLAPYAGAFSARAAQITRNIDRYEAEWRSEHPGAGARPGAAARLGPSRLGAGPARQGRARDGDRAPAAVGRGAHELGFTPPAAGVEHRGRYADRPGQPGRGGRPRPVPAGCTPVELERRRHPRRGRTDHRLGRHRRTGPGTTRARRGPDRSHRRTVRPLLDRDDVPEHVRRSPHARCSTSRPTSSPASSARAEQPATRARVGHVVAGVHLDDAQREVVAALAGTASCW